MMTPAVSAAALDPSPLPMGMSLSISRSMGSSVPPTSAATARAVCQIRLSSLVEIQAESRPAGGIRRVSGRGARGTRDKSRAPSRARRSRVRDWRSMPGRESANRRGDPHPFKVTLRPSRQDVYTDSRTRARGSLPRRRTTACGRIRWRRRNQGTGARRE
jgi:hypothetical protein